MEQPRCQSAFWKDPPAEGIFPRSHPRSLPPATRAPAAPSAFQSGKGEAGEGERWPAPPPQQPGCSPCPAEAGSGVKSRRQLLEAQSHRDPGASEPSLSLYTPLSLLITAFKMPRDPGMPKQPPQLREQMQSPEDAAR